MMQFLTICAFSMLVIGILLFGYQMYKMIELDANSRGLKHPKLWSIFSVGAQNGSGLMLYLIGRRQYPLSMSGEALQEMSNRKKKALLLLGYLTLICVALVATLVFN